MRSEKEPSKEIIEFKHLVRILGDVGTRIRLASSRTGRNARAIFEGHLASEYDRVGCFAYVGWHHDHDLRFPLEEEQLSVYAAYARAAVASGVYLGAMEPKEGFGLVIWEDGNRRRDYSKALRATLDRMMQLAVHAATEMRSLSNNVLASTSFVVGRGLLRGEKLFDSMPSSPPKILDGPQVVESIFGDIPNKCGTIAKGKDPRATKFFGGTLPSPLEGVILYSQPWILMGTSGANGKNRRISGFVLEMKPLPRSKIGPRHLKPFLIGLSLDFAQSSDEYRSNAHLARTIIDQILCKLESYARSTDLFISPRYGDGVGAVMVLEAITENHAKEQAIQRLMPFCRMVSKTMRPCGNLGLRVGMAIEEDMLASAPRLAGVGHTSVAAVELIAKDVILRAREAQDAKTERPNVERSVVIWLRPRNAEPKFVEQLLQLDA